MHLDTHVVVWLHDSGTALIPAPARRRLGADALLVSPVVRLELTLLHEVGRITTTADTVLSELGRTIGLTESPTPLSAVVAAAVPLSWTRDPFDRLICAQAVVDDDTLLTRDRRIRRHLPNACWDES